MRSADTTAEARAVQLDAYRAMSPKQRLEIALQLSEDLMALTRSGIRARHPDFDAAEVTSELHRILGHTELIG